MRKRGRNSFGNQNMRVPPLHPPPRAQLPSGSLPGPPRWWQTHRAQLLRPLKVGVEDDSLTQPNRAPGGGKGEKGKNLLSLCLQTTISMATYNVGE